MISKSELEALMAQYGFVNREQLRAQCYLHSAGAKYQIGYLIEEIFRLREENGRAVDVPPFVETHGPKIK